jgi:hypothetical protein
MFCKGREGKETEQNKVLVCVSNDDFSEVEMTTNACKVTCRKEVEMDGGETQIL